MLENIIIKCGRIVLLVSAITALVFACNKNKLDQPALGLLDESVLANKSGVEGLLIGAYALLDGHSSEDQTFIGDPSSAPSNWIFGSICGSEAHPGSDQNDGFTQALIPIESFTESPTYDFFESKWVALYAGVQRANTVLRIMRKAKNIMPVDTVEIRAEALFLRAYYHFDAKKIWNNIPFVDENVTYESGNYHVANDSSWLPIENDFKYAMDHLPTDQLATGLGRANQSAAKAFLAKVYMFEHKYSEARLLLQELIANGVTAGAIPYALTNNYSDNFNPKFKNGSESVFSVQSSVNDNAQGENGNTGDILNFPYGGPSNCCGFFQPSQWLVNHFKTDSSGLPDPSHFNDQDVINDQGYKSDSLFVPYSGNLDPRLDLTIGRRGIPYLDWGPHPGWIWVRGQDLMGPYAPKKNVFYLSQYGNLTDPGYWATGSTANNINLIRFADILLWAAEVEVEIGSLDQARIYVNQVRARAANPAGWVKNDDNIPFAKRVTNSPAEFDVINDPSFTDLNPFDWVVRKDLNQTWVAIKINSDGTKLWNAYSVPHYKIGLYNSTWSDPDFARTAIRYERVLELAMEGHRFFDLVRWGIADQEINTYLQKEMLLRQYLQAQKAFFKKGINERFPIPQREINLSAGADGKQMLKQNFGY